MHFNFISFDKMKWWPWVVLVTVYINCTHCKVHTNTWAAHIEGGVENAKRVAEELGYTYLNKIPPDHYHLEHQQVVKRSYIPSDEHNQHLAAHPHVHWHEQQIVLNRVKRELRFNDPLWPKTWYLKSGDGLDMNVQKAWDNGITGRGVVVTIMDDGIEKDHPDLQVNYDADASCDLNAHDEDPQPRYEETNENNHGTRCAGEVAAAANNSICSVGVAYNARIGGIRMLDGDVTDAVEASAIGHNPQHVDIYSASWGPADNGETVGGPAQLTANAMTSGIEDGRAGKGSIFVWASGNGGWLNDSCSCDYFASSIYTISISAAIPNGDAPYYAEACASTLATTFTNLVTTDFRMGCTDHASGTSASAPMAAGVIALALEANPSLTWRDVQHIIVRTARTEHLNTHDLVINGAGHNVSHYFGFGMMDASAMVDLAFAWTQVPEQHNCRITVAIPPDGIPVNHALNITVESDGCSEQPPNKVLYLEHVEAILTLTSSKRGKLQIQLTSPEGTTSALLQRRNRDKSKNGFLAWPFMTTHNWGEESLGTWLLQLQSGNTHSVLKAFELNLYGTETSPT